jgi:hypothetical protein
VGVIPSRELKCFDWRKRATGEDSPLAETDTQRLKHGERSGLETPVVHALTYGSEMSGVSPGVKANALSSPPEEYSCKVETQRN